MIKIANVTYYRCNTTLYLIIRSKINQTTLAYGVVAINKNNGKINNDFMRLLL